MATSRRRSQRKTLTTEAVVRAFIANRGNAKAAGEEVGCIGKTVQERLATEEGQRLLAEYTGSLLEQYHVSATRVVGEAAALAFSDLPRILQGATTIEQLNQLEPQHRAAISQVECDSKGRVTKLRVHSKLDALKLLAVYAEIAGMGATPTTDDQVDPRARLGGLTIIGPTEASHAVDRGIPRPEKLE